MFTLDWAIMLVAGCRSSTMDLRLVRSTNTKPKSSITAPMPFMFRMSELEITMHGLRAIRRSESRTPW